ncbi:hypothetical protein ABIE08_000900 [Kaistia defluvii]|uniref:Uncharacterized protein n=1 Tax=Kaistia defluvii TaxID=410841 RepID=A0ABV2QVD3_9HYPH
MFTLSFFLTSPATVTCSRCFAMRAGLSVSSPAPVRWGVGGLI